MQTSTRIRTLAVTAVVIASATPGMAIAATARTARIVSHPHPSSRNEVGGPLLAGHGVVVRYPARGGRPLPAVPASAYLIANASTGAVLAAKDAHGLFPPASTLKVLTAITMLRRLRPDATIVATKRAASVEPNIVGLVPGHRYKVADLFRALLLISANDAAVALAEASGSFSKGIALMNKQARHLQAYDVVAKQPNGLPAAGQVVSAYDLALIARRALQMPAFMRYDSLRTASFPVKRHKHVLLVNQNYLVTTYRGGLGGKIGWTMKAGATYVGMARRNGVTLIVTILHATPLTEITSAERLLNWGFAMSGQVRPVGGLVSPLSDARPVATRTHGSAPATGGSLARVSARAKDEAAIGAGVAAIVCACVLGGLAWRRRRAMLSRRQSG
jgi:D-alanyl-D-alanine carboxypeptidase (penicillin-binding protein 5/6)